MECCSYAVCLAINVALRLAVSSYDREPAPGLIECVVYEPLIDRLLCRHALCIVIVLCSSSCDFVFVESYCMMECL